MLTVALNNVEFAERPATLRATVNRPPGKYPPAAGASLVAKTYKSKALAELHENVSDLYRLGMIDKKTLRKFDVACLTSVRKLPRPATRRIRRKADVS